MARAHARILAAARYRTDIRAGSHDLIADEGEALGGADAGPAPYELLLAALGACTSITLKMYAERKGWPLEALEVGLAWRKDGDAAHIDRRLTIEGPLDEEQRARMADIAERTPVTLTLKAGVQIVTHLKPAS
jgi:putative redox protein